MDTHSFDSGDLSLPSRNLPEQGDPVVNPLEESIPLREHIQLETKRVIVIGSGIAGSETGTYLGAKSEVPLEVVEIEVEPGRKFGGWAFQKFPDTETTNLALRKMYLGREQGEIEEWVQNETAREEWATNFQELSFNRDQPIPRALIQEYVRWRRDQVESDVVSYESVTGEALKVSLNEDRTVAVELRDGRVVTGDRLIMASGSIAVKVPDYLQPLREHQNVIIDPLTEEGHSRRAEIPKDARVLILGTGLTGEEQVSVLRKSDHTNLTLLSRGGQRHFVYPEVQTNESLVLDEPPTFLHAETAEDFNHELSEFFERYLSRGHSPEDIFAAIRPHWDQMRLDVGGCKRAAERLHAFRRTLATGSIGAPWEVSEHARKAEEAGHLTILRGYISQIDKNADGSFKIHYSDTSNAPSTHTEEFDFVINAVGRNIIRHPIWEQLLEDGIAKKHAGIGVRVNEQGQMIDVNDRPSDLIYVVGMARAGDHALRHGFLGNTAFNVPQIRSHLYDTMDAMLEGLTQEANRSYEQ